jgi:tetratricopeptide (TPR) repeat protein
MDVLVYTPSHVDPAALAELTVSQDRQALLDKLVAAVRDEVGKKSHQHHILVGARGSGKTHTLALVVDRIRKDPILAAAVLPVVLAEEEVVRQPVDLLIRLLEQLRQDLEQSEAGRLPHADEVSGRLGGDLAQLHAEREHGRAIELAAAALDHAASTLGRLLLAVVENLDAMIGLGGEVAQLWELRKSLQHGKGLLVLAATPNLFGSMVDAKGPFHGFFRQHALDELSSDEMIALVAKRLDFELAQSGKDDCRRQRLLSLKANFDQQTPMLRGLIAYTGGLPRFGHLLFDLAAEDDTSEMASLMARFLDKQTPYFQTRLDPRMVPGAELEVLFALARAPGPLTTRQLADAQRGGSTNATAVLLKRLRERGLVRESRSEKRREVRFDVAEPLLRVWHRFRASRSEQEQILSLAEFVAAMFAPVELRADRACMPADSFSYRLLNQAIALHESSRPIAAPSLATAAPASDELSRQAEEEFLHGSLPKARELMEAAVARLADSGPSEALARAYSRLSHFSLGVGDLHRALAAADQGIALAAGSNLGRAECVLSRGDVLFLLGRNDDALADYDQAEPLFHKVGDNLGRANCMAGKGRVLLGRGDVENGLSLLTAATVESKQVGHTFNTELYSSLTLDGLAKAATSLTLAKLREHLAKIMPALSGAGHGEKTRNALVRLVRALLEHLGPEALLDLLPILEAALPAQRAGFLRPSHLAAEILAKRRPMELPDEPEEVRRTVREFLGWTKKASLDLRQHSAGP